MRRPLRGHLSSNPDLELNLLHHAGDSNRSLGSNGAHLLPEPEIGEPDPGEENQEASGALALASIASARRRRSSHEDLILDIIEGYFSEQDDEEECMVVDITADEDSGGSSQLAMMMSLSDTDFPAGQPKIVQFAEETADNEDVPNLPSRGDGSRVRLLDPLPDVVEYVEESGLSSTSGLHSRDLEGIALAMDSRHPESLAANDALSVELARCARVGKLRRPERAVLFDEAKANPGRESAEELHTALHPRYWGVTRAQLAKFESELGEAVRLGQVLNTSIVGDGTTEYSDELFERDGPTIRQVNAMFIRPRTNETAPVLPFASFALQWNDVAGLECELFVSHAWDQGVFDFVTSLLSVWPHRCGGAYISCLSNPQNLSIADLVGDPYEPPFFKVLMAQPRLMIMVASEVTPVHSRLWCCFEAYSAHFLGVPIEIAGNPVFLVHNEHRAQLESTLTMAVSIRLQEATKLGAESEDLRRHGRLYYFGAEEVAAQSLRSLVHATAPTVNEATCLSARERAVILAEMAQGMAAVNIFIKQQLLKRFAQECQTRVYTCLEETSIKGENTDKFGGDDGADRKEITPEVSNSISIRREYSTRPMVGIQQRLADFKRKREDEKKRELLVVLTWGVVLITIGAVIQSIYYQSKSLKWVREDANTPKLFNIVGVMLCILGFLVMSSCQKVDFDDLVVEHPIASSSLFGISAILAKIKGKYICLAPALLGVIRCLCPALSYSPFATTCMALYWLFETIAPLTSSWGLYPPAPGPIRIQEFIADVLSGSMQAAVYLVDRCWDSTHGTIRCIDSECWDSDFWKSRATPAAYHLLYLRCFLGCVMKLKFAADHKWDMFQVVEGFCLLLPLIGRDTLARCFERHFESQKDRRERDGAFIAEMLGDVQIELGQPWWIHLEAGEKNSLHPETHHQHHFVLGKVVEVTETSFSVRIPKDPKPRVLPLAGRNLCQDELVRLGRQQLRCIEWQNVTRRLFTGKNKNGRQDSVQDAYSLSRPVRNGERIDYFLSHSWHDDGDDKYDQLENLVASFRQKHGRFPTFWLDVVCISQDNIGDGLAVLPVNVMACHRILALAGSSYPKRLWCAVELATLFSFMPAQQAIRRIVLEPVGSRREQVLTDLTRFKVSDAHCYDPNEEEKILRVIDAVSAHHFENNIRMLAHRIAQDMNKFSANMVDIVARENDLRRQNEILNREVERHKSERETALQLLNETREEVRKLKLDNDRLRAQRTELMTSMASMGHPTLMPSMSFQEQLPSTPKSPPVQGRACSHSSFLAEAQEDLQHGDLLQDLPTKPSRLARARWMIRD